MKNTTFFLFYFFAFFFWKNLDMLNQGQHCRFIYSVSLLYAILWCITSSLMPPCCFCLQALDFIEKNKRDFGIARTKRIPVSGAFHTPLMASAKAHVEQALREVKLHKPIISVHANATSLRYQSPKMILKLLPQQIVRPVMWEQTLHVLYSRKQGELFPQTYEFGPGQQLGTMLKMTNMKAYEQYTNIPVWENGVHPKVLVLSWMVRYKKPMAEVSCCTRNPEAGCMCVQLTPNGFQRHGPSSECGICQVMWILLVSFFRWN